MQHDLIFSTREIKEKEGLTFSKTAPVEEFLNQDGEETESLQDSVGHSCISGTCAVDVQFSVGGERILLEAGITGEWVASCSRCLNPHAVKFQSSFDETYRLSQEIIDIRDDLRQAVVLCFPARSLCRPDCPGLCPSCGKDLNLGACGCRKVAR